ncbi:hypothetical protein BU24DRAFT_243149 [Aaosphaeria arxii CBS 175.79]|uniref:Uncharacterized protein n=1 Tax=Aaosphaeria arxii CBS 175.79 TaxID=1450172 RepID=A0A6A5XLF1_9PLEO|nr:uncharacterized protein BU24DRAFT_243149 [Aaosphaeria arxii CBS 175.79]KAF2013679.1 hypothetical protein BU24DRAFT_243149 [Aaosphaeria arxii CBS 175.79]
MVPSITSDVVHDIRRSQKEIVIACFESCVSQRGQTKISGSEKFFISFTWIASEDVWKLSSPCSTYPLWRMIRHFKFTQMWEIIVDPIHSWYGYVGCNMLAGEPERQSPMNPQHALRKFRMIDQASIILPSRPANGQVSQMHTLIYSPFQS